jgi:hypothetical protein
MYCKVLSPHIRTPRLRSGFAGFKPPISIYSIVNVEGGPWANPESEHGHCSFCVGGDSKMSVNNVVNNFVHIVQRFVFCVISVSIEKHLTDFFASYFSFVI